MIGKCIYCAREGEMSGEHYLPRCLGSFRGYELLNDRICEDCNNSFSPLDEPFCHSGPEAITKDMLGIEGRRGYKKISLSTDPDWISCVGLFKLLGFCFCRMNLIQGYGAEFI